MSSKRTNQFSWLCACLFTRATKTRCTSYTSCSNDPQLEKQQAQAHEHQSRRTRRQQNPLVMANNVVRGPATNISRFSARAICCSSLLHARCFHGCLLTALGTQHSITESATAAKPAGQYPPQIRCCKSEHLRVSQSRVSRVEPDYYSGPEPAANLQVRS